jgi:FkbM family methyltransferase
MDLKEGKLRLRAVHTLHRLAFLRRLAKRVCRGWVIRQPYYGGAICLDAIEHSWAWTGQNSYEKFDRPLQDALLRLSQEHPWLIDIGSNLGAMTLSVLLRNPAALAVAIDPNPRAHQLLQKSLQRNNLTARVRLVHAAVAPADATIRFDFEGSVVGHVAETGVAVPTVTVAELLRDVPPSESPVIKVDVEGFESQILPDLIEAARARRAILVIELHPLGLNGLADPARGLELLRSSGAALTDLEGRAVASLNPADFTQIVARWS